MISHRIQVITKISRNFKTKSKNRDKKEMDYFKRAKLVFKDDEIKTISFCKL